MAQVWKFDNGTLYYYGTNTGIIKKVAEIDSYAISDTDAFLFSISNLNLANTDVTNFSDTTSGNSVKDGKVKVDESTNNVTIAEDAIDSSTEITVYLNSDTCKNFTFNNSESDDVAVNVKFALSDSFTETFSGLNITTGSKADTVKVDGEKFSDVTINSGDGNDSISVQNATVSGGIFYVYGGGDSDTISVQNANVKGGRFEVNGNEGDDIISVENATVSGGNFFVHGDNTSSVEGDDSISVQNVSVSDSVSFEVFGDGGNDSISVKNATVSGSLIVQGGNTDSDSDDTISVQNVSVNGGAVNIYGYAGNDSISVQNATVSGGSFNVEGGDGDDSISVQNATVGDGKFEISGDAGNDYISLQNVSVSDKSSLLVNGNAGNDSISISNVTGKDKFFVLGGALENEYEFWGEILLNVKTEYHDTETDIFNVANSTGIGIASGENDSDTFAFNVASAVAVSIIGFDATDKITLSESVSSVTFNSETQMLQFGENVSIKVNDITTAEGFASLYSVAVTNGTGANSETTLGDLYDKATWSSVASGFTYGRKYGNDKNLISISGGLKDTVTADVLKDKTSGTTLTVQDEWLSAWNSQISVKTAEGYSVTLAENASVTAPAVWSGQGSSIATYKDAGPVSLSMTPDDNATIIAASDTRTNAIVLDGLKTNWSLGSIGVDKKVVLNENNKNIDSTTQLTISGAGGYLFSLYNAANVLVRSNDIGIDGSSQADTITAKDLIITKERDNILGHAGNDYISLQNVSVGGQYGELYVAGNTGSDNIFISGVSVGGEVLFDGGEGTDTLTVDGLTVTGGSASLVGGAGSDNISISGVTGNNIFKVWGGDGSTDTDSDIFNIANSTGVSIISGENDSDTFAFNVAEKSSVSISGLDISDKISLVGGFEKASLHSDGLIVFNDKVSIVANDLTAASDVAKNDLYNVSVYGGGNSPSLLGDLIDPLKWSSVTGGFTYGRTHTETGLISLSGGLNVDTEKLTANTSGTSLTFAVDWLAQNASVSVATSNGYSVKLSTESKVIDATWKFDNNANTANYLDSATATYRITNKDNDNVSVISAEYNPATLITLGGLANTATNTNVSITSENVVSLGSGAIGTSQISVNGANYTFDFATAADILLTSTGTTINGSEGADTITAKDLTITDTAGIVSINGNAGDDNISIENISIAGSGNSGYFYVNGGDGKDSVSVQNVSVSGVTFQVEGNADNDSISVKNVSVNNGNFQIYGDNLSSSDNVGADYIFVDGVTLSNNGDFRIIGDNSSGNNGSSDTISIKNVSLTGSNSEFIVWGGVDNDSISFDGVTVSGGEFDVYSGDGADTISVKNVSVASGYFHVYGNDANTKDTDNDSDIFNIENSTGIKIISGSTDSDTFAFNVASGVAVAISGLNVGDKISLSESVSSVTFNSETQMLQFGENVSIKVNDIKTAEGFASLYSVAVTNGKGANSETTLGDLYDKATWSSVAADTFTYGRKYTDTGLISISGGLNVDTEKLTANTSGTTLTVQDEWLSAWNSEISVTAADGYKVSLETGASVTAAKGWVGKNTSVAAYRLASTVSLAMTTEGTATIIAASDTRANEILLDGLKDGWSLDNPIDNTVTLDSGDIGTTQLTVSGAGYEFDFSAAANVLVASTGTSIDASDEADTITARGLNITSETANVEIQGHNGNDSIFAQNISVSGGAMELFGGVGTDSIFAQNISVSGEGDFYIYGNDDSDTISVQNVSVNGGKFQVYGGNGKDSIFASGISISDGSILIQSDNAEQYADNIYVQNVSMSGGCFNVWGQGSNDILTLKNVSVSAGAFQFVGDDGDDTLSVENATVSGGSVLFDGGAGNDNISVQNANVKGGDFELHGNEGNDSIFVQNANVKGGRFELYGDKGADTISISDVTGNGLFSVYGGRLENNLDYELEHTDTETDIFNIANSTGIQIYSGETDSDTFAFNVASGVAVSISGLNVGDSLSFSAAVTGEIVDSDTIKFTAGEKTITLDISGVDSLTSIYNLAVSNGGTETNLGDLIDPYKWSDTTSGFTYGRIYTETNLISISGGLNSSVTTAILTANTSGTTLTVQDEWLSAWNAQISVKAADGYSVALETGASVTAATGWVGKNTSVAAYRLESTVSLAMTFTEGAPASIIAASDTRTNEILLDGLATTWELSAPANKTVALDSDDIGTTQISVSGAGYTFNFETDASILLASAGTTINGSEGADTIAAKDLTVENASGNVLINGNGGDDSISVTNAAVTRVASNRFYVYGKDGNDTISVENVSVEGGGNFYVYGDNWNSGNGNGADKISVEEVKVTFGNFYVSGGADSDTISVQNVTQSGDTFELYGDAGNDNISVQNANVSGGSFNVYGGDDADTISVQNVTQSDGNFKVYGNAGNDSISVSGVTVRGGKFNVDGYNGADNISLENVSVTNNGKVTVEGGNGEDTISIRNVTGNGKFIVYGYSYLTPNTGDTENDIFNIANSTGISIKSGDTDSDTFAFNVASGVAVSISGLNVGDKITLSESVSSVTFNDTNDLLIFGENLSVKVNDIADAKDFINLYSVAVTNGKGANSETTLGDMLDPYKWIISGTTAEYRRDVSSDDKLFEITGLASGLTSDSLTAAATIDKASSTVTISNANILYTTTASISGNYFLDSNTALSNNSLPAFWNVLATTSETTTAKFFKENTTITYSISNDKKSITLDGDAAAQLQGVKKNSTFDVPTDNNITVADTAINSTVQITVSGSDYNFSLGSAANVLVASTGTSITGSANADTIAAKDLTISDASGKVFISGNGGVDNISASQISVSGSGKFHIRGDSDADTISVSGVTVSGSGSHFYIDGNEDADTISVTNTKVSSGNFEISGHAGNDSISVQNATVSGSGNFYINGHEDADTISVTNATVSSGEFYVCGDDGEDNISISGVTGNNKFTVWGGDGSTDTETDIFNIANSTGIKIYSGETDSDTFAFDVSSNITAGISGLNVGDSLSFSAAVTGEIVDSDTIKFTAAGNKTVTLDISGVDSLSSIYNLAVSNGGTETNLGDLIDPIKWSDTTTNSFTYGRKYGSETNLISISGGLNSYVTTAILTANTSGTTLTVQDEWLSAWNSEISVTAAEGYNVALEDNATVTAAAGWLKQSDSVAAYRLESTVSLAMTAGDDATIIAASDTRANEILLDGLKTGWSLDNPTDKTVALDENDIDSSKQISVSGAGYEFDFNAAADVLVASNNTGIEGSSQADTITAKDLTITSRTNINGNGGNDSIFAQNISVGSNWEFVIQGNDGADTISASGVTVGGGDSNSWFKILSKVDNDLLFAKNISVGSNGEFDIEGNEGADTISVSGVTVSGGKFQVKGEIGDDSISVEDVSVSSGNFYVYGKDGADNISISGVTGNGKFTVWGGNDFGTETDSDIFNIANSTGISIISGETDSDTFAFNVASGVAVSISGLNVGDTITLSESVSSVTFDDTNKVLKFGENLSIKVNDIADAKDFTTLYNVAVSNGGTETNLGDLIDPIKWSDTTSNSFTYGRNYTDTNLISIGGGLKDVTTETLKGKTSGTTLTVQDEWIYWNSEVSVTTAQGYSVALEDNASVKAATGWVGQNTSVAAYRFESTVSLAMTAGNDATIIAASDTRANEILLDGLKTGWELSDPSSNTVALDSGDIDSSTQLTVSGAGYKFDFGAAANVLVASTGTSIIGSSQADTISAEGLTVADANTAFNISGNAGADNISSSGVSVSGGSFNINGNEGADNIEASGVSVSGGNFSIEGGDGADNISVSGVSVGSGNVSINGGDDADTISVKGVTGNGKFYVYGGTASEDTDNDTFNIDSSTDISIISGDDDADTFAFNVSNAATVTIKGFTNKDIISLSGAVTAVTETGVLKLTSRAEKKELVINFDGTDIDAISDTKVIKGNGNQTTLIKLLQPNVWTINDAATAVYGNEDDGNFITVSNLKLDGATGTEIAETLLDIVEDSTGEYIKISEDILGEIEGTVTAAFSNQTTDDYSNYKLSLMNSETASASDTAHWNLNDASDVTYVSAYKTTGYVVDSTQNQITYVNTAAAFDSDTFTISGLKGTITKVESGEGYNFINLTGSTVTITSDTVLGTLNKDSVTFTGENYTLQLGGDVTTVNAVPTAWGLIAGEIDSIKSAEYYKDGTTAGYVLGDKAIRFDNADSGTLQFTINGLNSNTTLTSGALAEITVTDTEVKITSADILTTNDVTIETSTGIYSLALADNLSTIAPVETPAQWVFGKTEETANTETVIYNTASATEGWTFVPATSEVNAYIDYTEEIPAVGQATIAGLTTVYNENTLQNLDAPDGTFITLDSDILKGTSTVSLTSNIYHIALDQNAVVQYYDEEWATEANKITYTSARNDAGYAITARGEDENTDVVNFVAAARSDATITGLADTFKLKDISFGSDTFTLSENILTNSNVKLSTTAAYKLALGEDVSAPSTREKYWLASDTTIANYYEGTGTISGYTLADSQTVTYTAEKEAELTIQIDGLKGIAAHNNQISGITLDSSTSTVTVAKVIIGANGASVKAGEGYNYALGGKGNLISNVAGGVTLTGSTSNDSLTNKGGASVLDGDKGNDVIVAGANGDTISAGAGNDSITLGNGNDSVFYSGGNDVITGYAAGDTVTLADGKKVREASFDGTDLIVKLNSDKITFKDAKDTEIAVGENIYKNNLIYNADKTELTLSKKFTDSVIASNDFVSTVEKVDASNIAQNFSITANNIDSTIYGGKGNDTLTGGTGADYIEGGKGTDVLNGGAGNDTLIGDSGADTFVYTGGHDVITDYGTGNDIISISGASVIADSSVDKNGNVILTFDSDNTLTLNNAVGKTVSIKSGDEITAQIYGDNQIFNKKKTAVTVGADYSETEFDGSAYTALVTIDGAAAENDIFFTGNSKANKIYGGAGNDTLWGGAGNDTLTGNAGSDTFIYSAGKDVVTDFELGVDKISIQGGVEAITNATFGDAASSTLILTINKQTLKIQEKDGASLVGKEITINGAVYTFSKNQIFTADGTAVSMYSAFKGAYTGSASMVTIDGSAANGAMNIVANADNASVNNVIYGGRKADTMNGGAGNDTLVGGAGNDSLYGGVGKDTLTGGAGRDIFVFGADEGEDIITDYTAGEDKIKLINGAEITATAKSGEADIEFTIGTSGKVIVQKAAGKAITVIDANGKTTTQIYESASARTLDLLYDNNFMTDDAALDDITEAKYSVTDIEADSKAELEKAQALLTFSEDK